MLFGQRRVTGSQNEFPFLEINMKALLIVSYEGLVLEAVLPVMIVQFIDTFRSSYPAIWTHFQTHNS